MNFLDGIRVRESVRARRMSLYAEAPDRIELVVPRGTSDARIAAFVRCHADWIERARSELARRYEGDGSSLPATIVFPAVARSWRVRTGETGIVLEQESPKTLGPVCILGSGGATGVPNAVEGTLPVVELHEQLRRWLVAQARTLLPPRVAAEGERLGLVPQRVQVRLQRSRWGSCSIRRTISLNARSLFLEPSVLRYLIVHELCHLAHMAHSSAFWRRVAQYEPDYRRLDAELGKAWTQVPRWAYPP